MIAKLRPTLIRLRLGRWTAIRVRSYGLLARGWSVIDSLSCKLVGWKAGLASGQDVELGGSYSCPQLRS